MKSTTHLGLGGEEAAAAYLQSRGYRILARNCRRRHYEIDLIARSPNGTVCFIEVKYRSRGSLEALLGSVGADKRLRLARAASAWLAEHGIETAWQIDVIGVLGDSNTLRIEHLPNAIQVQDLPASL